MGPEAEIDISRRHLGHRMNTCVSLYQQSLLDRAEAEGLKDNLLSARWTADEQLSGLLDQLFPQKVTVPSSDGNGAGAIPGSASTSQPCEKAHLAGSIAALLPSLRRGDEDLAALATMPRANVFGV
jgi:hypothetical protein